MMAAGGPRAAFSSRPPLSVMRTVMALRRQRWGAVQTVEQYALITQYLASWASGGPAAIQESRASAAASAAAENEKAKAEAAAAARAAAAKPKPSSWGASVD